jgi:hypothetical protein
MSNYDELPDLDGPLPLDLQQVPKPTWTIPTTKFIRPCAAIEPETREFEGMTTVATRFAVLTTELPLAGAQAMKPLSNGELAITAHLRASAPWYEPAISLLDQQWRVQLWLRRPWINFRPIMLLGPPGCGKSHFARLIAERARSGSSVLSLAGVADSVSIEGTPRGYTTTMPCFPALTMAQHSTANPIVVIEEIYKATSSSRNGNPVAALLTQIEPGTARQYWDRCLAASINLSHVNWIFTSNSLEGLSAPLLSRMDIVRVTGPSTDHFDVMLDNLMNQVADEWGASLAALPHLEDEAEELLRIRFGRHRSVRRLERELRAAISAGIQVTTRLIS